MSNINASGKLINEPIYHGPLQESEQAALNQSEAAHKSDVQSSEILSPLVLMIILTILHSQIVATHTNGKLTAGGGSFFGSRHRGRKNSANGGAVGGGKLRSKRRLTRLPPRRKSNTCNSKCPSGAGTPPVVQIAGCSTNCNVKSQTGLDGQCSSSGATGGCKKVLFEDESKSWTSSNSDKDEGIADEYINENHDSAENDAGGNTVGGDKEDPEGKNICKKIIEANVAAALKGFLNKSEGTPTAECNINELQVPVSSGGEMVVSSADMSPVTEKRSSLRKRNLSKLSEASTTSYSCPDCSSNNNDSSSDEDAAETCGEIDDDDARSKSEWTAITTNSEDEDYGEDIHSEDDEDGSKDMQYDHPFAWEFEKVKKWFGGWVKIKIGIF